MRFSKKHDSYTLKKILNLHKARKLNLNPGFQRQSVWTIKDKRQLIDSVLRGLPIPNVFLWERKEGNKILYDVIDGKQRIEAILDFTKFRKPLDIKFDPLGDKDWVSQEPDVWTWRDVKKHERKIKRRFESYEIPVVIVKGDLGSIEDVFIRINSTGKMLSTAEIRHAKWYKNSVLLSAAEEIAKKRKYENYFTELGILSEAQVSRMKAVELLSELILSLEKGGVIDRKKALDGVMSNNGINKNTVRRISNEIAGTLDWIKKYFPELQTTRFKNTADFYALFLAICFLRREGFVMNSKEMSDLAFNVLNQLSLSLAEYYQSHRTGKRFRLDGVTRRYFNTVVAMTDSASNRKVRVDIIDNLLRSIFSKKDSKRLFSEEQKQLLWHSTKDKSCKNLQCGKVLSWKDVRMDHMESHTKGGRTNLKNAQILCVSCNSRKGAK